jgi:hypothetical protein
MTNRTTSLLRAAAEALEDGRDPLANPFLADNEVTLHEAYALAGQLATGARILAWAIEHPAQARAALDGAHTIAVYEALNTTLAEMTAAERRAR